MGWLSNLFSRGSKPDVAAMVSEGALLLDVRGAEEFATGSIPGAINIPHDQVAARIGAVESNTARPVVVYCLSGGRSAMAVAALQRAGYSTVVNAGGIAEARKVLES